MLTLEQMKERVDNYMITFDVDFKEASITKGIGQTTWVTVSNKRAMQWVEAGIQDLDCRSKERMLELINTWIREEK